MSAARSITAYGVDRAVLVGHSWGGNPVQELSYRHPERTAGVRAIRRSLLDRGMSADHLVTRGYWKSGVRDHPDGDYATDA